MALKNRDAEALLSALRADLPSDAERARLRSRLVTAGLAVGGAAAAGSVAGVAAASGAAQASLAAEAAVQAGWFAQVAAWSVSTKLAVVGAAIVVGGVVPVGMMSGSERRVARTRGGESSAAGHDRGLEARVGGGETGMSSGTGVSSGTGMGTGMGTYIGGGTSTRPGTDRAAESKEPRAPTVGAARTSAPIHAQAPAPTQALARSQARAQAETPAPAQTQTSSPALAPADARPQELAVVEAGSEPTGAAVVGSESALLAETRLIELALGALRDRDAAGALRAVEAHASRFPRGWLVRERERARSRALRLSDATRNPGDDHD